MKQIPQEIKEELKILHQMINRAKRAIQNGETVDIDMLDQRMADICNRVVELSLDDEPEIAPELNKLSESLMMITVALRQSQVG